MLSDPAAPGQPARRHLYGCLISMAHLTAGILVLTLGWVTPAKADIWGYVDSDRIPHYASSQLDERYELFLKDSIAPEPYRLIGGKALIVIATPEAGEPTAFSALDVSDVKDSLPPKLVAFFESSKNYKAISPLLHEASKTHGIDYSLLKAVITTESGFNPYAVSPKGAVGLMQVIPPTAERYGVKAGKNTTIEKRLTDPNTNIRAGARYLADLIKMFPGRLELALAAYNAGEGAVQRAGNQVPNYPETRNYVKTVMELYTRLSPAQTNPLTGRIHSEPKAAETALAASPRQLDARQIATRPAALQ